MGENSNNEETTAGADFDPSSSTLEEKPMAEARRETDSDTPLESKTRPDGTHDEYVTSIKLAIVVASVSMACFLVLLDTMIIGTAIPRITDQFKSLADVGWYASAYQFGSAAPQPLTGKVYTHFKNKVRV
ncbi:hypothetical protein G7Y89_g14700 [Cudoniella acicularis]|uniref:Major facilitator superfamily (MFS) profile domain-containing protein n=1 Tax=Cudoniella acicularis TaxID=354080 RepID=A0A8H4R1I3_9HELO|nr:hypothetical protein G7Y89_g14700 [Cudoniella acicularis]